MKIEEGMYVRTKKGIIYKIIDVTEEWYKRGNDKEEKEYKIYQINQQLYDTEELKYKGSECLFAEQLKKARHNIIDLIEKHDVLVIKELDGDLVKYEVEGIKRKGCTFETLGIVIREKFYSLQELEPNIKEIVTREQFESMSYKVEVNK